MKVWFHLRLYQPTTSGADTASFNPAGVAAAAAAAEDKAFSRPSLLLSTSFVIAEVAQNGLALHYCIPGKNLKIRKTLIFQTVTVYC